MRSLTQLRLERATTLLKTSDAPLAQVAELVGYTSEFAFNRAFKRLFHVAPGSYRRFAPRMNVAPFTMRRAA